MAVTTDVHGQSNVQPSLLSEGRLEALVSRRDEAMRKAEAALAADWPTRRDPQFLDVTRWAVGELEDIATRLDAEDASDLELGRTLRHLAGLHSDLAPALGGQELSAAERAYRTAEKFIARVGNTEEAAKIDFNLANTLRGIDPNDIARLDEARERVLRAKAYFAAHDPKYVAQCDQLEKTVEQLRLLAPMALDAKRRSGAVEQLRRDLAAGGKVDEIARRFEELKRAGGGIFGTLGKLKSIMDAMPAEGKSDPRYASVLAQVTELGAKAAQSGAPLPQESYVLDLLEKRLATDAANKKIAGPHVDAVSDTLRDLGKIIGSKDDSLDALAKKGEQLRELMESSIENAHFLSHGIPKPPAGSRAAVQVEMNWNLRRFLMLSQMNPRMGEDESADAFSLSERADLVDKRIYEAGSDDVKAAVVEVESLRPLAADVRQFSARRHVMPARPLQGGRRTQVQTSSLFFSGAPGSESILSLACRRSGLVLMPSAAGDSRARERWDQLQHAMVAVFDLRATSAQDLCEISYELGVALTLGRPIVVLVNREQHLPFDIDIEPIVLGVGPDDQTRAADAIDRATVSTHLDLPEPWTKTTEYVLAVYGENTGQLDVKQMISLLRADRAQSDPVCAARLLQKLFDYVRDGTMLIFPRWLPAYPNPRSAARIFHVTPFRPWVEPVSDKIRSICAEAGMLYVRGDQVSQPDIIRSIWEEIARAMYVVVDLSEANANVALEMGIAHTLGKSMLIIGHGGAEARMFPSVSRLRLDPYRLEALDASLGPALRTFLQS
jgi:hypothetical protein